MPYGGGGEGGWYLGEGVAVDMGKGLARGSADGWASHLSREGLLVEAVLGAGGIMAPKVQM